MRLRCQAENGTVPYWLDNTCRSYLSCTSYNLSMKTCDEGRAYRYCFVRNKDPIFNIIPRKTNVD